MLQGAAMKELNGEFEWMADLLAALQPEDERKLPSEGAAMLELSGELEWMADLLAALQPENEHKLPSEDSPWVSELRENLHGGHRSPFTRCRGQSPGTLVPDEVEYQELCGFLEGLADDRWHYASAPAGAGRLCQRCHSPRRCPWPVARAAAPQAVPPAPTTPEQAVDALLAFTLARLPMTVDGCAQKVPQTQDRDICELAGYWEAIGLTEQSVLLHVYGLNRLTHGLGLPIFHLGVEVYGREYSYSSDGVVWCEPGRHEQHVHTQTVVLGRTELPHSQVRHLVSSLSNEWPAHKYSLRGPNCQTFAVAFALVFGLVVPPDVCRFASDWASERSDADPAAAAAAAWRDTAKAAPIGKKWVFPQGGDIPVTSAF